VREQAAGKIDGFLFEDVEGPLALDGEQAAKFWHS